MANIRIYQYLIYYFFYAINLLLGNKAIFLCLFVPLHCFQEHYDESITDKKHQINICSCYPNRCTMTVVNQQRETPLLATDKTSKVLSAWSSAVIYLLSVLLIFSLSLISAIKNFLSFILLSLNCRQVLIGKKFYQARVLHSCLYSISKNS